MGDRRRLLLLSTSTVLGGGYLDYAAAEIRHFLGDIRRVLFVPFALHDQEGYSRRVRDRMADFEYEVESLHQARDKQRAMAMAESIFIGGGNTFRLLKALYDFELLQPMRDRVEAGMPYMGSSAGSNVAAPTIRPTNDMPIVQPPSFDALGLVPFQINPHYLEPDPSSSHMGETREERIAQFLEENATPVVGLREGAILRVENGATVLQGMAGARVFRRGREPIELTPGEIVNLS